MTGRRPRRPHGLLAYLAMLAGSLVIGGLVGGGAAALEEFGGQWSLPLTLALAALGLAVAVSGCVWWWRGLDEAAQEAHKWAWWWGGSGGMAAAALGLITVFLREDAAASVLGEAPADVFIAGMFAVMLCQLVGYSVAWAAWWLRHR